MTTQFDISALGLTVTEGGVYSFTLTPKVALGSDTVIRWEIVPKGELPISSSDFSALSGVVNFASGDTDAQTVTLTPSDDSVLEVLKHFELRVYEVVGARDDTSSETDDILIGSQDVTLSDDETDDYGGSLLVSTTEANILTAGNTQDLNLIGAGGDDNYVITRFQHGDIDISDALGANLIKFDAGVTITGYSESSSLVFGFLTVIESVSLTLSTGAVVRITSPAGKFSYQLGDGEALSYADFKTAIGASGTNETSALATDYTITTATAVPDISGNTGSVPTETLVTTIHSDVIGMGGDVDFSAIGAGGDDVYVITRFQHGDIDISDALGANLIKFDVGVSITGYSESSSLVFGFLTVIESVSLTLSTGAVVSITSPGGKFSYQLGDGETLDYDAFKTAIGASGTNADSALAADYTVTAPQVPTEEPEDNNAPVFENVEVISLDENTNASTVVFTAQATDADNIAGQTPTETITYELASGQGDNAFFRIDANTGEVRFLARPDYETQASYVVHVKAISTSTLGTGSTKETTQQYTVNLNDLNDTPPVITTTQTDYSVDENTETAVVQLTADKAVTWEILNNAGDGGLFEVDADGNLSFVSAPDYELARDEDGDNVYTVQVRALDSENSALRSAPIDITVRINNLDDNDPIDATEGGGTIHTVTVAGIEFTYLGDDIPTGFALRFQPSYTYLIEPKTSRLTGELSTLNIQYGESVTTLQQLVDLINKDFTGRTLNDELVRDRRSDDEPIVRARLLDPTRADHIFSGRGTHQFTEEVAPFTVSEDVGTTEVVFTAKATDADNEEGETPTETITYVLGAGDGDNSYFTIDETTGEVRFKNEPDYDTKSSYRVLVLAVSSSSLGDGSTASTLITYQVDLTEAAAPNTAPTEVRTIPDQTATEGSAFTLDTSPYFTDADGDTLTYSIAAAGRTLPSWLSIDANTGIISATPPADAPNILVEVTADDGRGGQVTSRFTLTTAEDTSGEDHVPHGKAVVTVLSQYVDGIKEDIDTSAGAVKIATISGVTDDDADITYEIAGSDNLEVIKEDDGSYAIYIRQNTALDFEGTRGLKLFNFHVRVVPEEDESENVYQPAVNSDQVNILVLDVDEPPFVKRALDDVILDAADIARTDQNGEFHFNVALGRAFEDPEIDGRIESFTVEFVDADGNVIETPSWLSVEVDGRTAEFSGTTPPNDVGDYTVRVTAADPAGQTATTDFTISVDLPPVFDIENEPGKTTQSDGGRTVTIGGIVFTYTGDVEDFYVGIATSTAASLGFAPTVNAAKLSFFGYNDFPATLQDVIDLINGDKANEGFGVGKYNYNGSVDHKALVTAALAVEGTGGNTFNLGALGGFSEVAYQFSAGGEAGLSVNDPVTWEENTDVTEIVFTASATDPNAADTIVYSFDDSVSGNDNSYFTIDAATGAVRFAATPDYETQTSYAVYVKATSTNPEGATSEATIKYTVELTDVAETSPAPPVQQKSIQVSYVGDPVGEGGPADEPAAVNPDVL